MNDVWMVHGSAHGGNAIGTDVDADPPSAAPNRGLLQGLHDGEAMRQFLHLEIENLHQGARLRLLRFIAESAVAMAAATLSVTSPAPLAASAATDCAAILDRSARLQCFTAAPVITGKVGRVIDGDTIDICIGASCIRVRLCGINAPERAEPGGDKATEALRSLASRETVRCVPVGQGTVCDGRSRSTNRGRLVAQCLIGDVDIGAVMVERGLACDWGRFSGGHYSGTIGSRRC